MRVRIIDTNKRCWHQDMLGEELDVSSHKQVHQSYILLDTQHNREVLARFGHFDMFERLSVGRAGIPKEFVRVVPATNEQAIQFLHE